MNGSDETFRERDGTIVESFVDFQKQLQFKLRVLNHAAKKVEAGKLRDLLNHPGASLRLGVLLGT